MGGRLVIIGSGETSPTMVKVHRSLIEASPSGPRAMLDTPFGFQANADDLTGKVQDYFAEAVGSPIEVARWRRRDEPLTVRERSLALLHRASFVFAGPGSPTYALGQWRETDVPGALADVLRRDGTVVLGSAAAVTAGAWSVPVYEIYKVGEEPRWVPGLDLVGEMLGLEVAVIPHFDNREGGRHDTRFCYLGEERMLALESQLPAEAGVIGVDEHTAAVLDLSSGRVEVHGAGGLTLRRQGREHVLPAGSVVELEEVSSILRGESGAQITAAVAVATMVEGAGATAAPSAQPTSLREVAAVLQAQFDERLTAGDADGALESALALEEALEEWSADTVQGSDRSAARRSLRGMMVALAGAAVSGLQDPRDLVDPIVRVALEARTQARSAGDYAMSDALRDGLAAAGIEVRDTPEGPQWTFSEQ